MPDNLLIPSVDLRIGSLEEYNRRQREKAGPYRHSASKRPCISISREYGCEAYPAAEKLRDLMTRSTGDEWVLMDKALLDEVAQHHNISQEILQGLGEKNRFLEEVLATFSPFWKSEKEYFDLLCRHILSLAERGNVIIVGRGSAIITRHLRNCHHFRLYASLPFKKASLARRLKISHQEAEQLIERKQRLRDRFTADFLGQDARDLSHYTMLFSNDRNSPEQIAHSIANLVNSTGPFPA